MLQTSIKKWLSKPKTITQPDTVPLETQHTKKPDSDRIVSEQPAETVSKTAAGDEQDDAPTSPTPAIAFTHDGSTTANHDYPPPPSTSPPTTTTTIISTTPTLPPLVPNITLAPLTRATIPSFRRLNTLLLEIPYPTTFYDEILTDPVTASITLAAFWRNTNSTSTTSLGILVAGIRCRLISASTLALPTATTTTQPPKPHLYIATLSTLSPYRSHGLASHLLAAIIKCAAAAHGIDAVCAHVWVANEEGLAWYRRRGFAVARREEGYYRRLKPSGAWVVWRRVGVGDLLGGGGESEGGDGSAAVAEEAERMERVVDGASAEGGRV